MIDVETRHELIQHVHAALTATRLNAGEQLSIELSQIYDLINEHTDWGIPS